MINFPINNTMFMYPQSTPESAWLGHIPFAGWLIEAMHPGVLVELGTHRGASYLAFCQAVQCCAVQAKCYAVDTWEGDEHAGVYGDEVFFTLLDYHQRNYADFSRLMRMRFEEAVDYFADGSVDLLHIDGLHTYDAVRNDFETWERKLSRRAVVLFHDINVRERDFGVWRYWTEIRQRYPSFEFTHTHGLGVLLVGEDQPEALRQLCGFTAVDGAPILVNRLFEHVGQLISAKLDIGTVVQEQGRLAGLLNQSEAAKGEMSADLVGLREAHAALQSKLDEQVAAYRSEVAHSAELSVKMAEVPVLMSRFQGELAQLNETLASREAELQRVQAEKLRHELAHSADLSAKMAEVPVLMSRFQEELAQLNETLASREAELQRVQAEKLRQELAHSADLSAKMAQVPVLMSRFQEELAQLTEILASKEAELQRIQAEKLQHDVDLERMRASSSWRVTAPMRALKHAFTKAPRR